MDDKEIADRLEAGEHLNNLLGQLIDLKRNLTLRGGAGADADVFTAERERLLGEHKTAFLRVAALDGKSARHGELAWRQFWIDMLEGDVTEPLSAEEAVELERYRAAERPELEKGGR